MRENRNFERGKIFKDISKSCQKIKKATLTLIERERLRKWCCISAHSQQIAQNGYKRGINLCSKENLLSLFDADETGERTDHIRASAELDYLLFFG